MVVRKKPQMKKKQIKACLEFEHDPAKICNKVLWSDETFWPKLKTLCVAQTYHYSLLNHPNSEVWGWQVPVVGKLFLSRGKLKDE